MRFLLNITTVVKDGLDRDVSAILFVFQKPLALNPKLRVNFTSGSTLNSQKNKSCPNTFICAQVNRRNVRISQYYIFCDYIFNWLVSRKITSYEVSI